VTEKNMSRAMLLGLIVFLALMVVEIAEYVVGIKVLRGNLIYMAILAIPGSWLIVHYFMHIHELWNRDKEE